MADVVIVGAGPAGITAGERLVSRGISPIIIDEGQRPGGQAYRMPSPDLKLDMDSLLGSEAMKYRRLHESFAKLRTSADYRSRTTAWGVFDGKLYTQGPNGNGIVPFDALILATGATDRILPIPGWTQPGVFTLGGAQVLLKDQGCLIGRRVVFCGSSPLLYLAALQYKKMGCEIAAVLDTSSLQNKALAAGNLASNVPTLLRGLGYMSRLKSARTPMKYGVRLLAFEGDQSVSSVVYTQGDGPPQRIECDAVAYGFGLKPETQLAELAGAKLTFNATFRQWLPETDAYGRAARGLYLAGDGAMIGGADAAELSGTIAACAVLNDLGYSTSGPELFKMRRRLSRLRRFQRGLAQAFAWPVQEVSRISDDTTLCRCENVKVGELRQSLALDLPPDDINRAKAFTRCGMGRCQGRFCGLAAAEITAAASGMPLERIGYLRAQAPVKPLAITPATEA